MPLDCPWLAEVHRGFKPPPSEAVDKARTQGRSLETSQHTRFRYEAGRTNDGGEYHDAAFLLERVPVWNFEFLTRDQARWATGKAYSADSTF